MVTTKPSTTKKSNETITHYEVAKEGAWCWFADPRALHYENESGTINKTYLGYIDIHGNIKATQYDFQSGETQEVLVRSWFQPDDHNNPTFLVLPDERIMILYSRHTDEPCFYYRVSERPGDITMLGPEFKIQTKHNTTYPSPFILSDDREHFYLCWRGISWHPTIAKLSLPDRDGRVNIVWGPEQIVQSTASRPYAKYASNGKDKIYIAYTTGHPDPTMPNYLYFNYIDINSMELKDVKDNVISTVGQQLHHVAATQEYKKEHMDAVVDDPELRDWLWQVVIDKNDKPAIALVRINENKTSHDYYYARWTGSQWQKTFLSNAGGHFHQSDNIEKCYSGGMAIDDQHPNQVYCSVPVSGKNGKVYELVKYTVDEKGILSNTDTLTRDSKLNNVRPFIVPHRNDSPLKLTWMYGNYYDWIVSKERPLGFNTSIYADYDLKDESADLNSGLVLEEDYSEKEESKRIFVLPKSNEFSIFLHVELDTSAHGMLVRSDQFVYGVDENWKPYINVDGNRISSNNILGNSDRWKTATRSTGGQWYAPVKYTSIPLILTYSNGTLTTYINGLIDQVVTTDKAQPKQLSIDKIAMKVRKFKVYKRKLNLPEIKLLSTEMDPAKK